MNFLSKHANFQWSKTETQYQLKAGPSDSKAAKVTWICCFVYYHHTNILIYREIGNAASQTRIWTKGASESLHFLYQGESHLQWKIQNNSIDQVVCLRLVYVNSEKIENLTTIALDPTLLSDTSKNGQAADLRRSRSSVVWLLLAVNRSTIRVTEFSRVF